MSDHPDLGTALEVDLHSHTVASGHAFCTLGELAQEAAHAGIKVLGVTDHGPSMAGAPQAGYFEMVSRVPDRLHGVRILMGVEANILDHDGALDLDDDVLAAQDIVLAGLHARTPYPPDCGVRENTRAVVGAISHPSVHVISHPWRPGFPVDVAAVAEAAAEHDTLLEINLSLMRLALGSPEGDRVVAATGEMVRRAGEAGGRCVISSDAHHWSELTDRAELISAVWAALGLTPELVVNLDRGRLSGHVPRLAEWAPPTGREG